MPVRYSFTLRLEQEQGIIKLVSISSTNKPPKEVRIRPHGSYCSYPLVSITYQ